MRASKYLLLLVVLLATFASGAFAQPKPRPPSGLAERLATILNAAIRESLHGEHISELIDAAMTTRILRGDPITAEDQLKYGLVTVGNSACSGVLLNNQWVLTAGHCIAAGLPRTATVTLTGVTDPSRSSHVYVFGGELLMSPPGARDTRGPDMALIRLNAPFTINGSTSGFRNAILKAPEFELSNRPVLVFGQGLNQLVTGPSGVAGAGVYRFGLLEITPASTAWGVRRVEAKPIFNPGPDCAFGDSGGPMFVVDGDGPKIASIVETADAVCTPATVCTPANTTEMRSCLGPKVYQHWETVADIIASTWNVASSAQLFDVGGAEWASMGQINGSVNVDRQPWAASARSANAMCFNRGFVSGHFNGHQISQKFGLGCAGTTGATWRDASIREIRSTPWAFTDLGNDTPWALASRAASDLCRRDGFVGGHFNGNTNGTGTQFGLVCYSAPAKHFDVDPSGFDARWPVDDVNSVEWAGAARAANDFCHARGEGFATGFMTGHQLPGKIGVVCH